MARSSDDRYLGMVVRKADNQDIELRVLSMGDWQLKASHVLPSTENCRSMDFSPDHNFVACGHADSNIFIVDIESGATSILNSPHPVSAIRYFESGATLASGHSDGTVIFWDTQSTQESSRYHNHTREITGICVGPGDAMVFTSSLDGSTRMYEVATSRNVHAFNEA